MKTDHLFHEYFQLAPEAIFALFQITPPCPYQYSSPVLKEAERRMDGLLEPVEPGQRYYFLEIQGYLDSSIYWRYVHEVGLYQLHHPELNGADWRAFLLFLEPAYDPGVETLGPLAAGTEGWLVRGVLSDLLQDVAAQSPVLNVLLPLVADDIEDVRQYASTWAAEIRQEPTFSEVVQIHLLELLTLFVIHRFSEMTYKEIEAMLKLTPLAETRAGQDLIDMGIEKGIEQGEMLILLRLIARKFNVSPEVVSAELHRLRRADFEALSDFVLEAESFAQIRTWIEARTHTTNGQ